MNEENLRRFDQLDPEEHREISVRGGKASGVSRQKKKLLREELTELLRSGDLQERICLGLIDKAISGDPRAFVALRDSLGEKLPDGLLMEVSGHAQDLQAWKEEHVAELQELLLEDLNREDGVQRYEGITSILTYQDRLSALERGIDG